MLPGERYGCPLVLEADYASGLVMFREFWHVPIPVGKAISDHYEEIAGNRLCEKVEGVPLARQDTWQGPVCRAVVGEELQAQQWAAQRLVTANCVGEIAQSRPPQLSISGGAQAILVDVPIGHVEEGRVSAEDEQVEAIPTEVGISLVGVIGADALA
jgi:hypothetical protein